MPAKVLWRPCDSAIANIATADNTMTVLKAQDENALLLVARDRDGMHGTIGGAERMSGGQSPVSSIKWVQVQREKTYEAIRPELM
jgi:hypothetical protein